MHCPPSEDSAVREHLNNLKQASWLGGARRWWPDFLFHCTAIQNVVSILSAGELLSRVQLNQNRQLKVDIASPNIIAQTDVDLMKNVRLYFRPRTPTQYNNEGFRPKGQWEYDSHCPIPVYLLFDAETILSKADCRFTEGNVAANPICNSGVDALRLIPFNLVYHDSWFDPPDRSTIIYHRNAEILVPERLGTETLQGICCRSQAEYETLMNLLPWEIRERWVRRIVVQPNLRLFFNHWTFVQQVEMDCRLLRFRFNQDSRAPGPFDARVDIEENGVCDGNLYQWRQTEFQAKDELVLELSNLEHPYDYNVTLYLDEQLAFSGRYRDDDLPF